MSQSTNRMFNILSLISLLVSVSAVSVAITRPGPTGPSGPTGATGPAGSQGAPGVMSWKTAFFNPTSLPGPAGTITNLANVTFTAPQYGYVMLTATGYCTTVQGASQTKILLSWWPDKSNVGAEPASITNVAGETPGNPQESFAHSAWFGANPGSNMFYFNGDNWTGDAGVTCAGNLLLIFTTSPQLP